MADWAESLVLTLLVINNGIHTKKRARERERQKGGGGGRTVQQLCTTMYMHQLEQ